MILYDFINCPTYVDIGSQKKWSLVDWEVWLSYTVTIVWEFAWADSALAILDELSSYRSGRLNRFDCVML